MGDEQSANGIRLGDSERLIANIGMVLSGIGGSLGRIAGDTREASRDGRAATLLSVCSDLEALERILPSARLILRAAALNLLREHP